MPAWCTEPGALSRRQIALQNLAAPFSSDNIGQPLSDTILVEDSLGRPIEIVLERPALAARVGSLEELPHRRDRRTPQHGCPDPLIVACRPAS
jgi:hypothetical protein